MLGHIDWEVHGYNLISRIQIQTVLSTPNTLKLFITRLDLHR